jgi:V-type H+-transporting ATPase subunit E
VKRKEQEERIKHSAIVNRFRLQKMQARNQALMKVFSDTQYQVYKMISDDPHFYKQLLQRLIVQGLIKMFEPRVLVRCLERDIDAVKSVIGPAKEEFLEILR